VTDARPQDILTPITESAIFLTVCVDPGGEEVAKELLPDLGGLRRSVGFRALDVVPRHVVHPGLLGGWGCRSHPDPRRSPDEAPR
jgi:hypothetical protein